MNVREIAEWVRGEVVGDAEVRVERPGKIDSARAGDLTFLANPKYEPHLSETAASAILVSRAVDTRRHARPGRAFVVVDDPYAAFTECLRRFASALPPFPPGRHPTAVIAESAVLGEGVSVGAHAVVGERARLGAGTTIHPGVVIAADVAIGEGCLVEANATIQQGCRIGNRVRLRAGCVVGAEGFGFAKNKEGRFEHIPQIGIVVIEDDCEVGCNATIARATTGETRVGRGTILDCHVHLAHNVTVGEDTAMAAQVGIAGSTKVGSRCLIGGQVGVGGHVRIGDEVVLLAQSGVIGSLEEPGQYFGYPAGKRMEVLRRLAGLGRIPRILETLRALEEEVADLRARAGKGPGAK